MIEKAGTWTVVLYAGSQASMAPELVMIDHGGRFA